MKNSNYKICDRCKFSQSECAKWNKEKSFIPDYCTHMEYKKSKDIQKECKQK
nr:MAG TPA: hypothetical protein [Caudoviricetes sp.]